MRRRAWVMVLLLAGLLVTACSQPTSVSAKPTVPVSSSTLAPTTITTTYPVTPGSILSDIFRNDGMSLMGAWPPDAETQAFITYYQDDEESCYQTRQSDTCPVLASPDVDAREYLQMNNQQAISSYQAALGYQAYSSTTSTTAIRGVMPTCTASQISDAGGGVRGQTLYLKDGECTIR